MAFALMSAPTQVSSPKEMCSRTFTATDWTSSLRICVLIAKRIVLAAPQQASERALLAWREQKARALHPFSCTASEVRCCFK
eukprot:scaffold12057_cov133-Isochrysis_galbana.AAC.4